MNTELTEKEIKFTLFFEERGKSPELQETNSKVNKMDRALVYLKDKFLSKEEAQISVMDLSVLRGVGIFDYVRTYKTIPFHLEDHLLRLEASADKISIILPRPIEEIASLVRTLIDKANFSETSVRIVVTGGASLDQFMPTEQSELILIAYPFSPYPEVYYEKGISVSTTNFSRFFPTCKTTHYLPAILALREAKKKGAVDILYTDREKGVLEGSTSNFFAFKSGTLVTPSENILEGITRKIVLHLAKKIFPIEVRPIALSEIPSFDAAFFTSSNREVMSIVKIDAHVVGDGKIHPNVSILAQTFSAYTASFSEQDLQSSFK